MTERKFEEIKVNAYIIAKAIVDTIKERQTKQALLDKGMLDVVNALNGVFKFDDVVFTCGGSDKQKKMYRIFIDSTDLEFEGEFTVQVLWLYDYD